MTAGLLRTAEWWRDRAEKVEAECVRRDERVQELHAMVAGLVRQIAATERKAARLEKRLEWYRGDRKRMLAKAKMRAKGQ